MIVPQGYGEFARAGREGDGPLWVYESSIHEGASPDQRRLSFARYDAPQDAL